MQDYAMKSASVEAGQQPEFASIRDRIQKQNVEYAELLAGVENKLHDILNQREPQAPENKPSVTSMPTDFVGSLQYELSNMSLLNSRLNRVLNHLQKIVG